MEEPPGTRRMRSAKVRRRAGKVSLSTKESTSPSDISFSSPSRKPSRMPCLTQAFVVQRPSIFSAARTSPRVRAARKSRKVRRALAASPIVSAVHRRSMGDFRVDSESDIKKWVCGETLGGAVSPRRLKPVLKQASNRSAEALHPITPKPGVLRTPALRHPKSNANKANGPELKANG